MNNPDSPSAPSYITADCGNVLTAFTQCLELENIFTYCKAITTNLVPLTSRYTSNDFISLTTINLSVRPTKKKKWKHDDEKCVDFQAHLAHFYFM